MGVQCVQGALCVAWLGRVGREQEVWLTNVKVPWQAWYGDIEKDLSLPEGWHVSVAAMNDGEPIDHRRCEQVLHSPTGTPPLEDLARKAQRASIVVEDITRPCPKSCQVSWPI